MRARAPRTEFIASALAKTLGSTRSRRLLARARRVCAWSLLGLPAALVLLHDAARRGDRIAHFDGAGLAFYVASSIFGALLWGALVVVAARRRGRSRWLALALTAAAAVIAIGCQAYTFERYAVYMDHQAVMVGTSMLPSIWQQLWSDRGSFATTLLPPLALAVAIPFILRYLAPARRTSVRRAMDLAVIAFLLATQIDPARGAEQGQPPDVLYLSAMGQLSRAKWDKNETVERSHPGPRTPIPVPALKARPRAARDVVFVVTESVRAMSTCVAPRKDCEITPFSNAAAPERLPFEQMRALDSTTAVSLAILWNGLPPEAPRDELHSAPLVWEYAKAAGIDTAYWTSQNLMFGNSGVWIHGLPLSRSVNATQIEPDATLEIGADDGALVDVALSDVGHLQSPYFAVVHLSNTHFPYKVDPRMAPFQPEIEATGPGYEVQILNRYHDSIYLQDRAVGRLIEGIRKGPGGERTVIVFTSDHGEQMREKGAVGHTGTLYEEELRVPFWIDAPEGALTGDERAALKRLASTPLTHADVLPTLLDLLGVWDASEIAPLRAKMMGQSLLRGGSPPERARFLTNCTELWQCAFKNWGAIRGTKKLIANQADHDWRCFDTATDPQELTDLGPQACGPELLQVAEANGRGRPFRR
jgi:glucan phosphoethanolaminetransferase (alkaline phosphatase superfamily)